jgi:hypothetical protein
LESRGFLLLSIQQNQVTVRFLPNKPIGADTTIQMNSNNSDELKQAENPINDQFGDVEVLWSLNLPGYTMDRVAFSMINAGESEGVEYQDHTTNSWPLVLISISQNPNPTREEISNEGSVVPEVLLLHSTSGAVINRFPRIRVSGALAALSDGLLFMDTNKDIWRLYAAYHGTGMKAQLHGVTSDTNLIAPTFRLAGGGLGLPFEDVLFFVPTFYLSTDENQEHVPESGSSPNSPNMAVFGLPEAGLVAKIRYDFSVAALPITVPISMESGGLYRVTLLRHDAAPLRILVLEEDDAVQVDNLNKVALDSSVQFRYQPGNPLRLTIDWSGSEQRKQYAIGSLFIERVR